MLEGDLANHRHVHRSSRLLLFQPVEGFFLVVCGARLADRGDFGFIHSLLTKLLKEKIIWEKSKTIFFLLWRRLCAAFVIILT